MAGARHRNEIGVERGGGCPGYRRRDIGVLSRRDHQDRACRTVRLHTRERLVNRATGFVTPPGVDPACRRKIRIRQGAPGTCERRSTPLDDRRPWRRRRCRLNVRRRNGIDQYECSWRHLSGNGQCQNATEARADENERRVSRAAPVPDLTPVVIQIRSRKTARCRHQVGRMHLQTGVRQDVAPKPPFPATPAGAVHHHHGCIHDATPDTRQARVRSGNGSQHDGAPALAIRSHLRKLIVTPPIFQTRQGDGA
jgi:hypothetical protein